MGDIRDELLKAGLISEQKARDISRSRREDRQRPAEERPASVERDRVSPPATDGLRDDEPGKIIRRGLVAPAPGNRRFHFVDRSGQIPFLELGEETIRGLVNGTLAVAEACGASNGEFAVVTADAARALELLDPNLVRFWNR
jgi:uncharacterized protein YaiL (DUF2058 family)